MLCRSKTSVMGMRIGSIKPKSPVSRSRPGRKELPLLRAPDAKRSAAETGTGSRSLPSDLSTEVSASSTASPPTLLHKSDGEAIPEHPASGQTLSAGRQAVTRIERDVEPGGITLEIRNDERHSDNAHAPRDEPDRNARRLIATGL